MKSNVGVLRLEVRVKRSRGDGTLVLDHQHNRNLDR